MPNDRSSWVFTASSSGAQKLGQPVPLSNFVDEENRSEAAAGASESPAPLLMQERTGERPLGAFLAQDSVLLGRQGRAPLGVAADDVVFPADRATGIPTKQAHATRLRPNALLWNSRVDMVHLGGWR